MINCIAWALWNEQAAKGEKLFSIDDDVDDGNNNKNTIVIALINFAHVQSVPIINTFIASSQFRLWINQWVFAWFECESDKTDWC